MNNESEIETRQTTSSAAREYFLPFYETTRNAICQRTKNERREEKWPLRNGPLRNELVFYRRSRPFSSFNSDKCTAKAKEPTNGQSDPILAFFVFSLSGCLLSRLSVRRFVTHWTEDKIPLETVQSFCTLSQNISVSLKCLAIISRSCYENEIRLRLGL